MALRTNESAEDYLECILMLSEKKPVVRSVDIANEMGFKKSSVSVAMKNLREREQITVSEEGYISLTESGKKYHCSVIIPDAVAGEHQGADDDACKVEHDVSTESFEAIKHFIENHK